MNNIDINSKNKHLKIIIIATLVLICWLMVYFFHGRVKIESVFTHFFYAPIIIATIWWGTKALWVPFSLSFALIISHVYLNAELFVLNDYFRILMFMFITFIGVLLNRYISISTYIIQKNEQEYRALFDNINDSVAIFEVIDNGTAFKYIDINQAGIKLNQCTKQEIIGKNLTQIFPAINKTVLLDVFKQVWETGQPKLIPSVFYSDEKRQGWFKCFVYKLPSGTIVCVANDETKRKNMEDALKTSEQRLSFAIDATNDGLWDWNISGEMHFSHRYYTMLGYEPYEIPATYDTWKRLIHPDDKEQVVKNIKEHINKKTANYENILRMRKKSGEWIWVLARGKVVEKDKNNAPVRMVGTHVDISDRKQVERTLSEKVKELSCFYGITKLVETPDISVDQILGQVIETIKAALEYPEIAGVRITWKNKIFATDNYKKTNICYKRPIITFGENVGLLEVVYINYRAITSGKDFLEYEKRLITSTTQYIGRIIERFLAGEKQILLTAAIEQSRESIFITDVFGNIQYVNAAFKKTTGYNDDEIIGKNPRILKSGKHDKEFYKNLKKTISSGRVWRGRLTNKMKDGNLLETEAMIFPVKDNNGKIINYVSMKRDITDEIKLKRQLRQAQKMEAIGTLAGGIAHDFNNILFSIIGYTELSMDDIPDGTIAKNNLNEVLKASYRARDLIDQILTFSKQDDLHELKPLKVQFIVKEALKLMGASLPSNIKITQNIDKECRPILGDPTQIHQIIMNLFTNAFHAMGKAGGTLNVILKEEKLQKQGIIAHPEIKKGRYIHLIVKDTGYGIDNAIIDRIFDPFFTTKAPGEGTGMGLAVVHGIVKNHQGHIYVNNDIENGTEFHVFLPITSIPEIDVDNAKSQEPLGGNEHILIVDDEHDIIIIVKTLLERLGYKISCTSDSKQALQWFKETPYKFDLVITDQIMPHMQGLDLAEQMIKIRHDIPIILCSGFSNDITKDQVKKIGIKTFIKKPVVKNEIATTIRMVLDSNKGDS